MSIKKLFLNGWTQENWESLLDAIPITERQIILEERNKEEMHEKSKYHKNGEKKKKNTTQITVNVYEIMVSGPK